MMPLAMCAPGERVEVTYIRGRHLRERLRGMGVSEGTRGYVLQGHGLGVILAVGNTRVALGQGAAHNVLVRVLAPSQTSVIAPQEPED